MTDHKSISWNHISTKGFLGEVSLQTRRLALSLETLGYTLSDGLEESETLQGRQKFVFYFKKLNEPYREIRFSVIEIYPSITVCFSNDTEFFFLDNYLKETGSSPLLSLEQGESKEDYAIRIFTHLEKILDQDPLASIIKGLEWKTFGTPEFWNYK